MYTSRTLQVLELYSLQLSGTIPAGWKLPSNLTVSFGSSEAALTVFCELALLLGKCSTAHGPGVAYTF